MVPVTQTSLFCYTDTGGKLAMPIGPTEPGWKWVIVRAQVSRHSSWRLKGTIKNAFVCFPVQSRIAFSSDIHSEK